jgi:hypothetical protein
MSGSQADLGQKPEDRFFDVTGPGDRLGQDVIIDGDRRRDAAVKREVGHVRHCTATGL